MRLTNTLYFAALAFAQGIMDPLITDAPQPTPAAAAAGPSYPSVTVLGVYSYWDEGYAVSVVAADATVTTYRVDCTAPVCFWSPFTVTQGPSTYAMTSGEVAAGTMDVWTRESCAIYGTRSVDCTFTTSSSVGTYITDYGSTVTGTSLPLHVATLPVTAGTEKLVGGLELGIAMRTSHWADGGVAGSETTASLEGSGTMSSAAEVTASVSSMGFGSTGATTGATAAPAAARNGTTTSGSASSPSSASASASVQSSTSSGTRSQKSAESMIVEIAVVVSTLMTLVYL